MNIKKSLLTSAFALGCLFMSAQQAEEATEYVFNPHWYASAMIGGQETLGEGAFDRLLCPNAQLAAGYQFHKLFGLRLGVNSWQSKGAMQFPQNASKEYWKWNYIAPALDLTIDLTHIIFGYNPERVVDLNLFGGIGANISWNNKEAQKYNQEHIVYGKGVLGYCWNHNQTLLLGRFGLDLDFRISNHVSLGIELAANVLNDRYNSKKAGNADWYFNGLVGVKYTFGKSFTKQVIAAPVPVEIQERVVEVVKEVPVEVVKEIEVVEPMAMERNVFFLINSSNISIQEEQKVKEIADYMKANPKTKVHITGYADKGTGTLQINLRLSRQRAEAVTNMLKNKYGIAADRITTSSMTSHEFQPFADPVLNRCAICVAE